MAAIVIVEKDGNFEIDIFRMDEELNSFVSTINQTYFVMKDIPRNAVQQMERYFRRRLTSSYFEILLNDPNETTQIRRLYEIGARR